MTDIVSLNLNDEMYQNIFNLDNIISKLDYTTKFVNEFKKSKNKQEFINEFFSTINDKEIFKNNHYYHLIDLEDPILRELLNLNLSKASLLNNYITQEKNKINKLRNSVFKILNKNVQLDKYLIKDMLQYI
jgi:hypothetical protein